MTDHDPDISRIRRAATLSCYVGAEGAAEVLVREGVDPDTAALLAIAGEMYAQWESSRQES